MTITNALRAIQIVCDTFLPFSDPQHDTFLILIDNFEAQFAYMNIKKYLLLKSDLAVKPILSLQNVLKFMFLKVKKYV
jgi:hypothetical protein